MTTFSELTRGTIVRHLDPAGDVRLLDVEMHGPGAATVTWSRGDGSTAQQLLFTADLADIAVVQAASLWSFDADGAGFLLAAEARRLRQAHLFDPHLALSTSTVRPLPHQIRAVYGPMLDHQPLRFLLADDPGAGKTIMTGLLIKELMLRGDLRRALMVAPGSLVEQWQDELGEKFGVEFSILTRNDIEASRTGNPFAERDLLIVRLDQLSRDEELADRAANEEWDLVVFDEAHKLSARYFGNELKKTKRYVLGETLGRTARNLLLLTATPHSGKEEDFQQFMALLDGDRFAGRQRDGGHGVDVDGLMRRMLKEDLLTFEGKPLFPERRANTVTYKLSPDEARLYEQVTAYVRDEMNRADNLVEGNRRNAIGFALTILQRRLASSPAAIHSSLERRKARLEERLREAQLSHRVAVENESTMTDDCLEDIDDLPEEEIEELEEQLLDEATAAATVEELQAEIQTLTRLLTLSAKVRSSEQDTKWQQLRDLVQDSPLMSDSDGRRRKLIIFTEHRDTLDYLATRLRRLVGRPEAVVTIHGGVRRADRKKAQELFAYDEDVTFLVATDAAGEGVNLQQAHLLVNYDIPWNPNRIEQRFGRIHRIGQLEVCHMWNLVAGETREGAVFQRLLEKLEVERNALDGRVYDVIGQVFQGDDLRKLLIEAIRYGDSPEVKAKLDQVVDERVGAGIKEVLTRHALHADMLTLADVAAIRLDMERAEARRLQPHYIRLFFQQAFGALDGELTPVKAEADRFTIKRVPLALHHRDRIIGSGAPLLRRYERVAFEKDAVKLPGKQMAALIAPGHPLFDATVELVEERHHTKLKRGAILVAESDNSDQPYMMVMLEHSIEDGRLARSGKPMVVSRRFQFVLISEDGSMTAVEGAPYLDMRPADPAEQELVRRASASFISEDVEQRAIAYAIGELAADHVNEVRRRTETRVEKVERKVKERLLAEINHWDYRANVLADQEASGKQPKMNSQRARQRAEEFDARLKHRLSELEKERRISPQRPVVLGAALVLPAGYLANHGLGDPGTFAVSQAERDRVERAAVDAVLAAERSLGAIPKEMARNNPGFDIESYRESSELVFIEVKGRSEGAPTVTVTKTEILTGLNKRERFILALVSVGADGSTDVRYIVNPFSEADERQVGVASVNFEWDYYWNLGVPPSKGLTGTVGGGL